MVAIYRACPLQLSGPSMPYLRFAALRAVLMACRIGLGAMAGSQIAFANSTISGRWTLVGMPGLDSADLEKAFLEISASGDLAASGGCNKFTARARVLSDEKSFHVFPILNTGRACLPQLDKAEARYIDALRAARYFRMYGNVLVLEDDNRKVLLQFLKTD